MKTLILFLAISISSGCATLRDVDPLEYSWQAMHLIDIAQTYQSVGRNTECFSEGDPLTDKLIGKKPSTESIIGWGIGMSVVHFFAGKLVDRLDKKYSIPIRVFDNAYKFKVISENHADGIYVDGINSKQQKRCDRLRRSINFNVVRF